MGRLRSCSLALLLGGFSAPLRAIGSTPAVVRLAPDNLNSGVDSAVVTQEEAFLAQAATDFFASGISSSCSGIDSSTAVLECDSFTQLYPNGAIDGTTPYDMIVGDGKCTSELLAYALDEVDDLNLMWYGYSSTGATFSSEVAERARFIQLKPSATTIGSDVADFYSAIGHDEVLVVYENHEDTIMEMSAFSHACREAGILTKAYKFSTTTIDSVLGQAKKTGLKSVYLIATDLSLGSVVSSAKSLGLTGETYLWVMSPAQFPGRLTHDENNTIHGSFRIRYGADPALPNHAALLSSQGGATIYESSLFAYDAMYTALYQHCVLGADILGTNSSSWPFTPVTGSIHFSSTGERVQATVAIDNLQLADSAVSVTSSYWDKGAIGGVDLSTLAFADGTGTPPSFRGENHFEGSEEGYHLGDFDKPICWLTNTNPQASDYGVTKQATKCPPGLDIEFLIEPPSTIVAGKAEEVRYKLTLGTANCTNNVGYRCNAENAVILNGGLHVPHANIHSCSADVSMCSPAIPNDGTLATHTPAKNHAAQDAEVVFNSTVVLTSEGAYTVIAHGRVFTAAGLKWDIAKAVKVVVTMDTAVTSVGYHLGDFDIPVCWRTSYDPRDPTNYGVPRQLNECVPGLNMTFTSEAPDVMYENEGYVINYTMTLGRDGSPNVLGTLDKPITAFGGKHIPHINLHSCGTDKVGFCTPYIANDGNLATHTPALTVQSSAGTGIYDFSQELALSKGSYQVIAHGRVFTDDGMFKYDIAKAMRVNIKARPKSTDSEGYHLGDFHIPICWKTILDDESPLNGITQQQNTCPDGLDMEYRDFSETVSKVTFSDGSEQFSSVFGEPISVQYSLVLAATIEDEPIASKGGHDVSHANLHFCNSRAQFCTPFIANDGELATHSAALKFEDVSINGFEADFNSTIGQLAPASYTMIAHGRVFTDNGFVKWDIAKAIRFVVQDVPPPIDHKGIDAGLKSAGTGMAVFNMVIALILAVWVASHRSHAVIRFSQPAFLLVVLVGVMISSLTIIFLGMEDSPEDLADENGGNSAANFGCRAATFTYSIGFILIMGTMFAKIWRVVKMFNQAKRMKILKLTTGMLFRIIFAGVAFDALILFAWLAVDPLEYRREVVSSDIDGNPTETAGMCVSDNAWSFLGPLLAFHVSLLLFGCRLAYKSTGISTVMNESKYISFAMVSYMQVIAISIPILIMASDNPNNSYFTRVGVVFLNDLCILGFIFVPKIILFITHDESTITQGATMTTQATQGTKATNATLDFVATLDDNKVAPR